MKDGDPLPMDFTLIAPSTFVGEVVMKQEITPFLAAYAARLRNSRSHRDHAVSEQIPLIWGYLIRS